MEVGEAWRTEESLPGPSEDVLYQLPACVDLGSTLQIHADLSCLGNEVCEVNNRIGQFEAIFRLPSLSMVMLPRRCFS